MTAQMPDSIIIDGARQMLFSEPLEAYYQSAPRPAFVPQSTANWRGYVGNWEIRQGRLYLTSITAALCADPVPAGWNCKARRPATLADLFPGHDPGGVFAAWFSGRLRVPLGRELEYVHMGYQSVYEFDLVITVEQGVVTATTTIDNRRRTRP